MKMNLSGIFKENLFLFDVISSGKFRIYAFVTMEFLESLNTNVVITFDCNLFFPGQFLIQA